MKKHLPLLLPAFACSILLAGCVAAPPLATDAVVGGGMYATKPGDAPPADLDAQMAPHESWCYATMGEQVDCYAEPQATPPGRLVNVDPPNRYPLTSKAYQEVLEKSKMQQQAVPISTGNQAKNPLDASGVMDNQGAMPPAVQPTPLFPVK